MRRHARRAAAVLALALCAACASGRGADGAAPRTDRNLITREQIVEHGYRNAHEAVSALRPAWMVPRGTDSFVGPTEVLVYQDGSRVGGVGALRWIPTTDIRFIRYYDGVAATARWGLDHGQGVIFVSSSEARAP
ncbi:MAG TPA: hypothetical protein VHG51_20805 [Longimicrobiaceae bacterium]|nr:hypothetical protein [Longimicrobiaceae bacterium]